MKTGKINFEECVSWELRLYAGWVLPDGPWPKLQAPERFKGEGSGIRKGRGSLFELIFESRASITLGSETLIFYVDAKTKDDDSPGSVASAPGEGGRG